MSTLSHFTPDQGRLDAVQRAEKPEGKVIHPDAHLTPFLYLNPGMPPVEVVSLREPKTPHVPNIDRLHDRVDQELILEELIELTVTAAVVMGADAEFDALFLVVDARWPGPGRGP